MDIFSNLTDDQIALLGCVAALISSGGLMVVSHYIGRMRGRRSLNIEATKSRLAGRTGASRRAA
ncbi:MAG: hypothetical protein ABGZ17_15395 [Planctomycetaceae bacterium]